MKRFSELIVAVLCSVLIAAVGAVETRVFADESPPPSKMSGEDAARLDAAFSHKALADLAAERARSESQEAEAQIAAICTKYRIDRAALGRTVGVDVKTGEIQRAPEVKQSQKEQKKK